MFRYENKGYNQTVSCKHPESSKSISVALFSWTCVRVQLNDAVHNPNGHLKCIIFFSLIPSTPYLSA